MFHFFRGDFYCWYIGFIHGSRKFAEFYNTRLVEIVLTVILLWVHPLKIFCSVLASSNLYDWLIVLFSFLTVIRLLQGIFPWKRKISWVLEFLRIDTSYIPGWLQIHQVANDDFQAQSLLLPPQVPEFQGCANLPSVALGTEFQAFLHARLVSYQLSYISTSQINWVTFFPLIFSFYSLYLLALHVVKRQWAETLTCSPF